MSPGICLKKVESDFNVAIKCVKFFEIIPKMTFSVPAQKVGLGESAYCRGIKWLASLYRSHYP